MSDQYLGEIRVFPYNFAPYNWIFCNGAILPIQQYTALFSLLGVTYGGNGTTNFQLPDLQGRVPMHPGTGAGLSPRNLGDAGGSATVGLTSVNMPSHNHSLGTDGIDVGDQSVPSVKLVLAQTAQDTFAYQTKTDKLVPASLKSITPFPGGGGMHNNLQPYLALNFCIALSGIYPTRP